MIFLASATVWAAPQKCPTETDTPNTPAFIIGTLEYHPGVYAWYGVHPSDPVCGQKVIQVGLSDSAAFREAHRFVGCEVTATGNLFVPDTGYWSTSLGLTDAHIQPGSACQKGDPLPDYSAIPVPPSVYRYKVAATYNPKTEDFSAQVHDAASEKLLSPWQQYVSDVGNGARDLQRMYCAEGFVASAPKDALGQPDLQANIDPDSPDAIEVALPNDSTVQISFVCTRSSPAKDNR
ncbi:MAG: hypothetical protein WA826_01705 [Silvibacterium sp.]